MELDAAHTRSIQAAAYFVYRLWLSGIYIAEPDDAVGVVFNGLHHTVVQFGSEYAVEDGQSGSLNVKAIH